MLNNIQTNCIIIHGCPSNKEKTMDPATRTYDKHWIPWLKTKLINAGIRTEAPLMPDPWEPDYEKFKAEFEKYIVDENTILVGHSCGSSFLVRWLGETQSKVKKLILVAPWKIPDENDKYRQAFYTYNINPEIKNNVQEIIMFTSDTEEEAGKISLQMFHNVLGGQIIELHNHGHFTLEDMGKEELPELLEIILN